MTRAIRQEAIQRSQRRAQSAVEYAVVISVVVAAVLLMQIYMKRGVQGKLRGATDEIGEQYVPGQVTSDYTMSSHSSRQDLVNTDGSSTSTLQDDETQSRSGSETVDTSGQTHLFN